MGDAQLKILAPVFRLRSVHSVDSQEVQLSNDVCGFYIIYIPKFISYPMISIVCSQIKLTNMVVTFT